MLSLIVYGRNDSHGYNLPKRVAISLNALAEILTDQDEIIFVDYNTPDDLVTFPEAIADTLSPTCKQRLRILRIRPALHHRLFRDKTDLQALEAVSRNAAIRRSNPQNNWILSTNTDMLFAPRAPYKNLTEALGKLSAGFYELPRYELPDLLWEGLNRLDPKSNIEKLKDWGTRFHVNEVVHRGPEMLFDAPGDFQLFPRDIAFTLHGFDEAHLLGWHMDANLAKRMHLHFGETKSAAAFLEGWHCNHTRSASLAHRPGRRNNDFSEMFHEVTRADLPLQKDSWGLPNETLEEIRLDPAGKNPLTTVLERLLPPGPKEVYDAPYISAENLPCPTPHAQVYLADLLFTFPRSANAGYLGFEPEMFEAFKQVWKALGFTGTVRALNEEKLLEDSASRCDLFIAAYAPVNETEKAEQRGDNQRLLAILEQLFKLERARLADGGLPPRKFMVINGGQRDVAGLMARYTNAQENPFGTRLRHGYVTKQKHNSPPSGRG